MKRLIFTCVCLGLLVGCGDDESSGPSVPTKNYPQLSTEDPLDYDGVELGIGVRAGDVMALSNLASERLGPVVETFPNAVYHVQSYDEAAQEFGEFVTFPAPSSVTARQPVEFTGDRASAGRHSVRVSDLDEEVTSGLAAASAGSFASTSVVLDFWRIRNDWWVRWDGLLDGGSNNVGQGAYGFSREEFVEDMLDEVEAVATNQQPRYFIIGHAMEQTVGTANGGIAPAELSNFTSFYIQAVERVKAASPNTKVGVGFNWDRFATQVAPLYAEAGASETAQLDTAFETVILPLAKRSDIIALSSYTTPQDERSYYQFLRRLEDLYELEQPIVYYSVGSPVDNPVDSIAQSNYLEDFASWNAGVNVEFIAWKAMNNFDGSDTADQVVTGRCAALTGEQRQIEMELAWCYDGLFTSIFTPKDSFKFFTE